MTKDDVPYEEKRKAYADYKLEWHPDYYTGDGSFIVYEQLEGVEWWPISKIEPTREQGERWWALTHEKAPRYTR